MGHFRKRYKKSFRRKMRKHRGKRLRSYGASRGGYRL